MIREFEHRPVAKSYSYMGSSIQKIPSMEATFQAAVDARVIILGAAVVASSVDGLFLTKFLTSAINFLLLLYN
jgi:hypothetical protein